MSCKMAYLGPPGTYSHQAAILYLGEGKGQGPERASARAGRTCQGRSLNRNTSVAELVPCSSLKAVFQSVSSGETDVGLVPVENSWEGPVHQTLDLLVKNEGIMIRGEITLPIRHTLVARRGARLSEISAVLSHPQALAQCALFLDRILPAVRVVETASTAEAMRLVSTSRQPWGAIGSLAAAEQYGLAVLAEDLSDMENNQTRFLVIAGEDAPPEQGGKTSLVIEAADRPGSLYMILGQFYARGINLTRIESRPARTRLGEYRFFIDLAGSRREPRVKEALESLSASSPYMRVLGSYPALVDTAGSKQ